MLMDLSKAYACFFMIYLVVNSFIQGKLIKTKSCKFQFMILGTNTNIKVNLFLYGNKTENSQEVVLFRINIDDKLSFKTQIKKYLSKSKI